MAYITLNASKLSANYTFLDNIFREKGIQWAVVSKLLCGNRSYLEVLLSLGIKQVCDSRVSNLRNIKEINPKIETIYIKPPSKINLKSVVQYADISMNTEIATIKMLSEEAMACNKIHKIIIMVEMGELREGIMRDKLMDFYREVFELSNIEVIGLGTNLSCMYGVLPNHDKLIQLSLYKQLIEAKFNRNIKYISGGSSVTIPLIFKDLLPAGINHFRVGESLFLGNDVYNNRPMKKMKPDVFLLYSEIIELIEKPSIPDGEMGSDLNGDTHSFDSKLTGKTGYRAIIDIGLLDTEINHLFPTDNNISIIGASSDMLVIDLGKNLLNYKVGDRIKFRLDYMGALRLLNSKYIEKRIVNKN